MAGNLVVLNRMPSAGRSGMCCTRTLAKGLGVVSILLGVTELVAPRAIARFLGMPNSAPVLRGYGVREVGTGVGILLSEDPTPWIWGRVAGDVLDIATVACGLKGPKTANVVGTLVSLAGIAAIDVLCGQRLLNRRTQETRR